MQFSAVRYSNSAYYVRTFLLEDSEKCRENQQVYMMSSKVILRQRSMAYQYPQCSPTRRPGICIPVSPFISILFGYFICLFIYRPLVANRSSSPETRFGLPFPLRYFGPPRLTKHNTPGRTRGFTSQVTLKQNPRDNLVIT